MQPRVKPSDWLMPTSAGLYCVPADLHIDPARPVARAVVTHGHGDHARPNNAKVLATPETLAIMAARYGAAAGGSLQALTYGTPLAIGDVTVRLVPAGHILGAAQVVLEHGGQRIVVSGDYKRRPDATCAGFEPVSGDVFVSEATFGLPVFRHPDDRAEIGRLLASLAAFPERTYVVGVYALGKCQRVLTLLRAAGYERPIYLHGALIELCALYRRHGVDLGLLEPAIAAAPADLKGAIVLCPPQALAERWTRRLNEPLTALASGWMRIRQRAKQLGVELPLVISDHADWDELTATFDELKPGEIWITHGREDALVHWATTRGYKARALSLAGRDEEGE
jgi:putative mRNA 3-end processing factor